MYGFRRQAHQEVRSKQYTLCCYDMATFGMNRLYDLHFFVTRSRVKLRGNDRRLRDG